MAKKEVEYIIQCDALKILKLLKQINLFQH